MRHYIFYKKKYIYKKNVKIYRKKNSKKEYVKYKNEMILIKNYKKKMKTIIENKKLKKYKQKSKGGIFFKSLAKRADETKKQIEICCANSANDVLLVSCLKKHNIGRNANLQTLCNANKNYERERLITNRYSENDKKSRFERMLKGVEHRVDPSLYSDKNILRSLRGLPRRD